MQTEEIKEREEQPLYNEDIKNAFLNEYEEGTRYTYKRIFEYSYKIEKKYGKDLYDFNSGEIAELLKSLNPLTFASSRTNGRIVSAYIYWAVEHQYRETGFNPLSIADNDWLDKFVDTSVKIYLSEREIHTVEEFCENYQDSCIIRAIFEGVSGKKAAELTNLKKSDVNFLTNTLTLMDGDEIRTLEVSERCIFLLKKAIVQRYYAKNNGYMDDAPINIKPETRLEDTAYVLRNSHTNNDRNSNVDIHTIYRRLDTIKTLFKDVMSEKVNISTDYLTVKNIAKSGMIYEGYKVLLNKKKEGKFVELTKEDYEKIAARYKVNVWSRLKEFVNMENIEKLYGDESEWDIQ